MAITRTNGVATPVTVTGRELNMYTVSLTNVHVGYNAVDSDFEKLVLAIETVGSVEILGTPATGAFRVAVSAPAISGTISGTQSLQGVCNTAVATTTVADFTF